MNVNGNTPLPEDSVNEVSSGNETSTPPKSQKKIYKGYTFKEKWLVCLLLSLFAPFAVFFVGPFEIYGNNASEFKFVLSDFWLLCGLVALVSSVIIFDLLILLRGRAFDVVFGLIFGLSLMLFIQGNYLSIGADSLSGDGLGGSVSTLKSVINLIIWIVVVGGCVAAMLFLDKYRELIRLICTVTTVALVGMTAISFAVISMTTDVYSSVKTGYQGDPSIDNEVLTVKNLDTLAADQNIVVFIVDRFDHSYMDKALGVCPEIFDELDGFTHFRDYVSLYPRTYPGIPHIITGVENDFVGSRLEYFENAYSGSPYLQAVKESGYDINVYTDSYYGYSNATHMRDLVSNTSGNINYSIVGQSDLSMDMIRVSLFRYLPFLLRDTLGNVSTPMFDKYTAYGMEDPIYSTDMKNVYSSITDGEFTLRSDAKGLSYIHVAGCHMPNAYGPDFGEIDPDDRYDSNVAMKQSFKIISEYIKEMKRLGLYESSTILILGDHCSIGYDSKPPQKPHITTLLAKPAGVSEGELKTSYAQVSADDVLATVLTAAGSDKASEYGENIFNIPEDKDRIRRYYFQVVEGSLSEGTYTNYIYEITGPAADLENWRLVSTEPLNKNIYD